MLHKKSKRTYCIRAKGCIESNPDPDFSLCLHLPSNQGMHCSTVIQLEMGLYCMEYALFRSEMQDSAQ